MPSISDYVLDAALSKLDTEANALYICSSEPATYAAAIATVALGNSTAVSIAAPVDRPAGGRQVTVAAISGGSVTATGTAGFYALVDTTNSRLLATGALQATQAVTQGNTFNLASFLISIPDPV